MFVREDIPTDTLMEAYDLGQWQSVERLRARASTTASLPTAVSTSSGAPTPRERFRKCASSTRW